MLSEAIFCIHFNAGRMRKGNSKINTSFDCLILNPIKRIQVKSCSVSEDLTDIEFFDPHTLFDSYPETAPGRDFFIGNSWIICCPYIEKYIQIN